jgi:hypothetical protein
LHLSDFSIHLFISVCLFHPSVYLCLSFSFIYMSLYVSSIHLFISVCLFHPSVYLCLSFPFICLSLSVSSIHLFVCISPAFLSLYLSVFPSIGLSVHLQVSCLLFWQYYQGVRKLTGDNLKVVWIEFSTVSHPVLLCMQLHNIYKHAQA